MQTNPILTLLELVDFHLSTTERAPKDLPAEVQAVEKRQRELLASKEWLMHLKDAEWTTPFNCRDCGAKPGDLHIPGCDTETCAICGWQAISCPCVKKFAPSKPIIDDEDADPTPEMWSAYDSAVSALGGRIQWSGLASGVRECVEFGWFARWDEELQRHVRCDYAHPNALPDLNRVTHPCGEAKWDKKLRRFVKR